MSERPTDTKIIIMMQWERGRISDNLVHWICETLPKAPSFDNLRKLPNQILGKCHRKSSEKILKLNAH